MKRVIAILWIIMMTASLTACGGKEGQEPETAQTAESLQTQEPETTEPEATEPESAEPESTEPEVPAYNKETETYTIERDKAKVSFELAKELGYEAEQDGVRIKFKSSIDNSKMNISVLHDNRMGTELNRSADQYSSDSYKDFSEITLGGYEGYEVYKFYKSEDAPDVIIGYEARLILTEPDDEGLSYALYITVDRSPTYKEFKAEEFVKGEDFMHMLESVTIEIDTTAP